jgi:hypothetical protein
MENFLNPGNQRLVPAYTWHGRGDNLHGNTLTDDCVCDKLKIFWINRGT